MAVTVDNTIARVSNDGGTAVTSGSFDVTADDLLVVCTNWDELNDSVSTTCTLSDNQTPDLTYTTINVRGAADAGAGSAKNEYHDATGAISGLTITATLGGTGGQFDSPSIKVYKCTGHDTADIIGAIGEGNLTTDPQTTSAITSETAGAFFANWTDWNETGTPTSSDLTIAAFHTTGDIAGASGFKTIGSAGASVTGNINSGGTPAGNWTVFEIRAAAAASKSFPFRRRVRWHPQYRVG